ncbi:CMRF35-like molecule 3 isoform X2 [Anguilla anguilla]|uniref:CMRF35-like molecule 3 isoform X2 n=1 Tax=Anguilla anguilla TaxID=7936 RepID=UPI0015AB7D11|nr:CMRF35-like molecule 3 isoform X2 [Anguilla anguilla]
MVTKNAMDNWKFFYTVLLPTLISFTQNTDGVRSVGGGAVRLPNPALSHVRVHDQLHPQAEAPPGEVHDEQRAGELHHPAGIQGAVVTGREGESRTFCCRYDKDYTHRDKYWCRGESFSSCRIVVTSLGPQSGRTSLKDRRGIRKFCVTIKDLKVQDSGAYWCAISAWGPDIHVAVALSIDAARPVTPSKPSTASPTTKPATTIAPSPSTGPPAATSAATLEPPTTPPSRRNETGSKRPEKPSTLTILSISTGLLLLFLCLACVMATVWRRTGSRGELEGKGDSSKSFAEATEIQYAEVTVNTRSQPLSDFVTYGNLYFHTIAEDRSQEGSVEYAAVKR